MDSATTDASAHSDATTMIPIGDFTCGAGGVYRLSWSPDSQHVVAGGPTDQHHVPIWSLNERTPVRSLTGHTDRVYGVSWSPAGGKIATCGGDCSAIITDLASSKQTVLDHRGEEKAASAWVYDVAWSPDEGNVVTACHDYRVRLWDSHTGDLAKLLEGHNSPVYSIAWSRERNWIASGAGLFNADIFLWGPTVDNPLQVLRGHSGSILSLAWSPGGSLLASASTDRTIRIWKGTPLKRSFVIEGHTGSITAVSFSPDGRLLASKSADGSVRFWCTNSWSLLGVLCHEIDSSAMFSGLAFAPSGDLIASAGPVANGVRVWRIDAAGLTSAAPVEKATFYANAKVVIVGDSGVGKTALFDGLRGLPYKPVDSTHGRHVSPLDQFTRIIKGDSIQSCEILLWDLAGQPGYRLVHQLHLGEVSAALVVFDARSETEPLAGVRHWDRALEHAQRLHGADENKLAKYLVAARIDRGGVGLTRERIDKLILELGFLDYFETSAAGGWQVAQLGEAIKQAIRWDELPAVRSSELFDRMRDFVLKEKEAGRVLTTEADLYRSFQTSGIAQAEGATENAFRTCAGLLANRDLIRRLDFGGLMLLQPELLDSYAAAIVIAARREPDGLGCVNEDDVLAGRLPLPEAERVDNKKQEALLLIATIEELVRHEIAIRESTSAGRSLVFPSQFTRDLPDAPDVPGKVVLLTFEGPLDSIYSTLAVRLANSDLFTRNEMWRRTAVYSTADDGRCGFHMRELDEATGELSIFFDKETSPPLRRQFENYVVAHLQRRALNGRITRRRVFSCSECGELVPDSMANRRRAMGKNSLTCPICTTDINLVEKAEDVPVSAAVVLEIDQAADVNREKERARVLLLGKISTGDYDVFMCYNNVDIADVRTIATRLQDRGILPWIDETEIAPGSFWQQVLQDQFRSVMAVAIFLGPEGLGRWQNPEQMAFIQQSVERGCRVIPVILPGVQKLTSFPPLLQAFQVVDFRKLHPDPFQMLLWGITGFRTV